MLILSRNIGEAILIGADVSVTVSNVCGSQVRLAIDAPRTIEVDRAEIRKRKIDNPRPPILLAARAMATDSQQFDIDEHVQMARDAARYRWIRNVAFDTPRQDLALRDRHHNMLIEQDLDAEIDRAMHAYPGELEVEPCES